MTEGIGSVSFTRRLAHRAHVMAQAGGRMSRHAGRHDLIQVGWVSATARGNASGVRDAMSAFVAHERNPRT